MIEACGLAKRYGRRLALAGVDLAAGPGDVLGLIGPNGAGKTTTIRILSSLLRPDAGWARIGGHDVVSEVDAVRRAIGYMPELFGLYDELTVEQYLDVFARVHGFYGRQRRAQVEGVIELVDLAAKRRDRCEGLSKGVRQRLFLARTLLHDPAVLLLDEPASGLDPQARIDLRALLTALRAQGKTILISSHILSELEQVCSRVVVIEGGRLAYAGSIAEVRERLGAERQVRVRLVSADDVARASTLLARLAGEPEWGLTPPEGDGLELRLTLAASPERVAELHRLLVEAGARVYSFEVQAPTLEALFLDVTRGLVA